METIVYQLDALNPDQACLDQAAALLKEGQVVAFPTETVYGLGAVATNAEAVAKIFQAKGRPADNPLIVHIAQIQELEEIAYADQRAYQVAEAFWPGPLTLILPKKDVIPEAVTAGLSTVAVRMPAHPIAQALIKATGAPIAAPSANISGKPSPTQAQHVLDDLAGKIPLLLDGGTVEIGLESTVLDLCSVIPQILRPGKITAQELTPLLGRVLQAPSQAPLQPSCPGMKYAHYAPQGQIILSQTGQLSQAWQKYRQENPCVICWEESSQLLPEEANLIILGHRGDYTAYAKNLFTALRLCDTCQASYIIIEEVAEEGLGVAIMNRLRKATR